jgi:RNA polymerase sigma-70 factor, ECF subfamily
MGSDETAGGEGDLMRRARDGDAEAFGALVTLHMRPAYFAALGLVGTREDALDLSQEAFARAFRARRRLDPDRPFYPWYYTILRRLCFNFLRDRRLHARRLAEATNWFESRAADLVEDPAALAERREDERRVAAAIATLPDRDREVLMLKEFEHLTYREIAALVGIPIGTVMSRLYAARQRLAAAIEGPR